jgi:hypothetical protein
VSVFREAHALMSKLADYWPPTSQISHLLRQLYRSNRTSALLCSHFSHSRPSFVTPQTRVKVGKCAAKILIGNFRKSPHTVRFFPIREQDGGEFL